MLKNAITEAIARLGGRGTGTKRLATLLDLTTARVYQLATVGIVPHAEQASKLSKETGIPFEDFLILKKPSRRPPDPNGKGRKDPKPSAPLTLVTANAEAPAGATEEGQPMPAGARLGTRVGRYVRAPGSACSQRMVGWKRA